MKIGTDGMLLGAWSLVHPDAANLLDIGTGTGIVALMMAQRYTDLEIDAVEPHEEAHAAATSNFERSPWGDRLFCYHAFVQELLDEEDMKYDCITCNPPYFKDAGIADDGRSLARDTETLPLDQLLVCAYELLNENGSLNLVLPTQLYEQLDGLLTQIALSRKRHTRVRGNASAPYKRHLVELVKTAEYLQLEQGELTLEQSRHNYTPQAHKLLEDFLIKL